MVVKKYLIASIIVFVLKVLFGFVLNSNTLLASSILEVMFIVYGLLSNTKKENKKYKGIITSIIGILLVVLSIGIIFYSIVGKVLKPSWFIILIALLVLIIKYIISCFSIVGTYSKKKGNLLIGNSNTNMDFIVFGIIIGSLIICKLSKFVSIFKYADILGTILIGLIVIYFAGRLIINSIKYMEGKEVSKEINLEEISKQKEVKKIDSINIRTFGGLRVVETNLVLADSININDLSGFALSLQDYLLKFGELCVVNIVDKNKVVKKVHVRSKKQDARNSGSRNSKTNSKKKNTKKTNKKR